MGTTLAEEMTDGGQFVCSMCLDRPRAANSNSYCRECRNARQSVTRPKHSELPDSERRKANTRSYTNVLIHRGTLAREPCEKCGAEFAEAHHLDYANPRVVRWLCPPCHRLEHRTISAEMAQLIQKWTANE